MAGPFSWGHININVADLDASVAFYRKLGFEPFLPGIPYLALRSSETGALAPETAAALGLADGTRGRACIMQLDDGFPKIDLTELDTDDPREPLGNADRGLVRICLISGDLSADYARLRDDGVPFVAPPTACHERLADVALCRDPDGTLIEILQVYLDRWGPYLS